MRSVLSLVVFVCFSVGFRAVADTVYDVVDLGVVVGGVNSYANGINNAGEVVGSSTISTGEFHAFRYSNGVMQDLHQSGFLDSNAYGINDSGDVAGVLEGVATVFRGGTYSQLGALPGGHSSVAYGINSSGAVVGASTSSQDTRPFVYRNGIMTNLGALPGSRNNYGWALNDGGVAVGWANDDAGHDHATLYASGLVTDLGTLGGLESEAFGINSAGVVVGGAQIGSGAFHAFIYADDTMQDIGTLPGFNTTIANHINTSGEVVGTASASGQLVSHAFVYSGNAPIDLNSLIDPTAGWILESATANNDHGQIVGTGLFNGQTRAFLLNPIDVSASPAPLPSAFAGSFVLAAICLVGRRSRATSAIRPNRSRSEHSTSPR